MGVRKLKVESGALKYYLFIPTLAILIFMTVVPLAFSLITSFTGYKATENGSFAFNGIDNFVRAWGDTNIRAAFWNTLTFVFFSVGIEFVLGMALAVLLNRQVRGITFIRTFLLLPMMVTPVAVGLLWRWMFNTDYGLINYFAGAWFGSDPINWLGEHIYAMPVVILVDVWQWTPFVVLSLLAGLQSLSSEPYEAGNIDGASAWQIYRYITLPQLKSVILVVLLIRTIDSFKSFDVVWILTNGGPGVSTELFSSQIYRIAFKFWETGYASAVSWIFLIVVMVITSLFIRFLYREDVV
ncbi:ABC transporter permease [Paenibacillus darwinianus]|uniref:ABC transporter permease n=1 Tax=Paenibacillus darwinianus TaxID=1380763 RepID=A0A9W5S1F2_9BACL|nr:sugar ABC transporter permease [Paenibacillus darwinianus]EXX89456.1 ABC transporter permease [Paenibacillus darwinianus]EXX91229.1 ABC transporter permease [Paenibacillus darwinianus]EXX92487.1 ABC transporter permease [Paenibacillus darwinianus]